MSGTISAVPLIWFHRKVSVSRLLPLKSFSLHFQFEISYRYFSDGLQILLSLIVLTKHFVISKYRFHAESIAIVLLFLLSAPLQWCAQTVVPCIADCSGSRGKRHCQCAMDCLGKAKADWYDSMVGAKDPVLGRRNHKASAEDKTLKVR